MSGVPEDKTKHSTSNVSVKNDWRETSGKDHVDRFNYLLESKIFSDFEFIVGLNKEPMKAHKLVLKIGSPIFEAMLDEGAVGSGDGSIKEFNIPDIEPEIFNIFLEFLYSGDCTVLKSNQMIPLLRVAKTFKVPDLIRICIKYLETAVTERTALIIFQQAVKYEEKELEEQAIQLVCRFAFRIVETNEFLELSFELLEKLVVRDDLTVFDEIQLFEALIRWAEAQCRRDGTVITNKNVRSILENLIPLIRFPQILPSEFSLKVTSRGILLTEEVVSVLLHYNIPVAQRSNHDTNKTFNLNPRNYYVCETNCILRRLKTRSGSIKITSTWHRICFKADIPVWMTSVGLNKVDSTPVKKTSLRQFPSSNCSTQHNHLALEKCSFKEASPTPSSYMVEVRVEDYDLESIYAKKRETVLKENNTSEHYQIKFEKPVKILPNTWYTASLRVEGNYFGTNYKKPTGSTGTGVRASNGTGGFANIEFKDPKEVDLDNPTCFGAGQMALLGFHIPT